MEMTICCNRNDQNILGIDLFFFTVHKKDGRRGKMNKLVILSKKKELVVEHHLVELSIPFTVL